MKVWPSNLNCGKPDVIQLWCPVINFGRCFGIIPLKTIDTNPYIQRCMGSTCASIGFFLLYSFAFVVSFLVFKDNVGKANHISVAIVESSKFLFYYCHCLLTLAFFLYRSDDLVLLIKNWVELEQELSRYKINLGASTKNAFFVICTSTLILFSTESALYLISQVFYIIVFI